MPVRYQNSSLSLGRRDAPKSIDLGGAVPRNLLPISPPETDRVTPSLVTDTRQPHSHTSSLSFPDGLQVTPPTATGEPPSRYRRSPSIPYMQSGLQSRTHLAPNRPARWLVVVMSPKPAQPGTRTPPYAIYRASRSVPKRYPHATQWLRRRCQTGSISSGATSPLASHAS